MSFVHLHNHTMYSLLDGASHISKMYKKAAANNMPGIAITDHGNMFGVFEFVAEASKHKYGVNLEKGEEGKPMKPIVGCEFYIVEEHTQLSFSKDRKDRRYHQILLAKNRKGYENLTKLCSIGYSDGLYGKYPRIDKNLVMQYHEGLIATTCCLGAMVPRTILDVGEAEGEKELKWWFDLFGEDFYIELQRHGLPEQDVLNEVLVKFSKKYNIPLIATNDSHYLEKSDAEAHDILLCINTNEKLSTPKLSDFVDDDVQSKSGRFAFPNDEFYFKSQEEMSELFADLPQAIDNTMDIFSKIEPLKLKQDLLLPAFQLPSGFIDQDEYLRHLTYLGAKERYHEITQEIQERLDFELFTVKTMGFAGYFLIVADFIKAGREIGVFVGPGRGSAAGSAIAFCIGITNIDPIKYSLLFERFLNPDRKSWPDIDTDFDDEGRQKVIDYVVKKYGSNQVAHIVTYGTMAAKMSIKDVSRAMELPLAESNALAKLVPEKPGIKLNQIIYSELTGDGSLKDKYQLNPDEIADIEKLRAIYNEENENDSYQDLKVKVLESALKLEGTVRNTGIHAAGIIIAPKDLSEILPVFKPKDLTLYCTQYEGNIIEDAGVLKMDFLGLKTLSILKDAIKLVKKNHDVVINLDTLPLDDAKVFELYQRGDTNGTFQFESLGMQKYLRDLKPDKFEDLIAMNALFRPGPMEYIPNYIKRKHGLEAITYDLPEMQEYLEDTYGITVYQEQVMLLSQKLANFTKGEADTLRKAMGKKDRNTLDGLKSKFIANASGLGHDKKILEKIWGDWEKFAQYAFNKSHSTCYAYVAYHTAYLKAYYPAEYMSAVLTHSSDIKKNTFFMDECKRMGIPVLGPDVNESDLIFSPNKKGEIRFAINAIKGVGEVACADLIQEREANGPFVSIFDMAIRLNTKTMNKRVLENLIIGGALDGFGIVRNRYLVPDQKDNLQNAIDKAINYGTSMQNSKFTATNNLFGEEVNITIPEPEIPAGEEFPYLEKLRKEKDAIGIYLSGHPLDTYDMEIKAFANCSITELEERKNQEVTIACIVATRSEMLDKRGETYGRIKIEDYDNSIDFTMWSSSYQQFKHLLEPNTNLLIKGKYQLRSYSTDVYEFRPQSIIMLGAAREKLARKVVLHTNLLEIKEDFLEILKEAIQKYPGKVTLQLNITDEESGYRISLEMPQYKVNADDEMMAYLGQHIEAKWSLN